MSGLQSEIDRVAIACTAPAGEDLGAVARVRAAVNGKFGSACDALRRVADEVRSGVEPDAPALHSALSELRDAAGALAEVGQPVLARIVGAMESAAHAWLAQPERATERAAGTIERAGLAVVDYLDALLAGRTVSTVALFPQYRDLLEMEESEHGERVHPADLWTYGWHWADVEAPSTAVVLVYDPAVRSRLDREVLRLVRNGDEDAARELHALCLGLAHGTGGSSRLGVSFWLLAAGFFEALASRLVPADAYVKRTASRVLMAYAALSQAGDAVSDYLGRDLLFFCAQAQGATGGLHDRESLDGAATLRAVRSAWNLVAEPGVDYTVAQFGRSDSAAPPGTTVPAPVPAPAPSRIDAPAPEIDELRVRLGDIERALDRFYRRPEQKAPLHAVPAQMRLLESAFSALGLDQAVRAVRRMHDDVERLLADDLAHDALQDFDVLGNNLGALGLLVDMLGYQPELAQRAFVFDVASGELKPPAAGGDAMTDTATDAATDAPADAEVLDPVDAREPRDEGEGEDAVIRHTEDAAADEDGDEELLSIFLDEARDVLRSGAEAVASLDSNAADAGRMTVLRRVFHTLKGSARLVGLGALGDAAAAFEQLLNTWLAEQRPATTELLAAVRDALHDLSQWIEAIATGRPHGWRAQPFNQAADRLQGAVPEAAPRNASSSSSRRRRGAAADAGVRIEAEEEPTQSAGPVLHAEAVGIADAIAVDALDVVDAELFPVFEDEAAELLLQLAGALREWVQQPEASAPRASALRALHTLKGGARLAGAMRLGERAHRMESAIEALGWRQEHIAPEAIDRLFESFDALQVTLDGLRAAGAVAAPRSDRDIDGDAPASTPARRPESPRPAAEVRTPAPLTPTSAQTVRIRTQLLDRMVAQAGEVVVTRSRLATGLSQMRGCLVDLTGNLDRLRQQLRDLELQVESRMQSRLAQAKDAAQGFDPLEFDRFTRVQELTRMMAESVDDVATVQRTLQKSLQATDDALSAQARQTRELQHDLLRTRMVEFESISERLSGVVRQASRDSGKQVRLDINGSSIEIDRGVLERMTAAFEHLLRNAVAHGIEDAATRQWAGKNPVGSIAIDLQQEGNDVAVGFRDDGAGLDARRIAERARVLGLIGPETQITNDEAAEFIFRPGFSTAGQVSELSGRGIGMDVVRTSVGALGGRIETQSTAGVGTRFKLVLPLTTAVTHVVMLRAGEMTVGVPANLVELVQRANADDLETAYVTRHHSFGGEQVPFYWMGALLQSSARSEPSTVRTNFVVIVRSAARRVALHVDEIQGNQEVVVRNLGPQLSRLAGMAAVSVLSSGAVALIYNPVTLADAHGDNAWGLQTGGSAASMSGAGAAPLSSAAPLVLVVDDSLTVRRVTQRLLQREGFRVALAADGLQALEMLNHERPAVVLSDIEMPRMDGFDLVRHIRADASLASLPIIMISSRIAPKHRELAKQLGVNHYVGKPFGEEELVLLIQRCTQAEET